MLECIRKSTIYNTGRQKGNGQKTIKEEKVLDIQLIKNLTLEVLLLGVAVFLLVMLVKWPIKRATAKFKEPKRKAVNVVIALLPPMFSLIASVLYFGMVKQAWLKPDTYVCSLSIWLVSASLYAIYSKAVILIKAAISGDKINPELTKEVAKQLKANVKSLCEKLTLDQKQLDAINKSMDALEKTKQILMLNGANIDKISQTNINLKSLEQEQTALKSKILGTEQQIDSYKKELYVAKGEEK